jgi:hypothetical protein
MKQPHNNIEWKEHWFFDRSMENAHLRFHSDPFKQALRPFSLDVKGEFGANDFYGNLGVSEIKPPLCAKAAPTKSKRSKECKQ